MDLNSTFDTNIGINMLEVDDSLIQSFRFLNVGAGFVLTKGNLFPTNAAPAVLRSYWCGVEPYMYDVYSWWLTRL